MKDWAYTFDPVSKDAWIAQIEKDLRGKPMDALVREWWPGETLQPLLHQEDAGKEVVRLPDSLFKAPPRITESIQTAQRNPAEINSQILDALTFGAEKMIIQTATLNDIPISDWLKDVHLDMINVQLEPEEIKTDMDNTLVGFIAKGVEIRIVRKKESPVGLAEVLTQLRKTGVDLNAVRFIYEFPSTGIWNESVVGTFNRMLSDLDEWIASGKEHVPFFRQTILSLEGDPSYFKQIIQTRVLHVLWNNLMVHYELESGSLANDYLECHIRDEESENPDQYLIRASMSGLAASLVGTPSLCIHHLTKGSIEDFYKRTNRNIHHLLNLESTMYQGTDPLAGAYAIDYYTIRWTKIIWEGLNL